jgi:hypothetical protein
MTHAEQLGLISMVLVAGLAADVSQNHFRKHQARNSGKGRPGCLGGGGSEGMGEGGGSMALAS